MGDLTEIDVEIITATEEAICIENLDGETIWIPKRFIEDSDVEFEAGESGEIEIPVWLAIKNGLV